MLPPVSRLITFPEAFYEAFILAFLLAFGLGGFSPVFPPVYQLSLGFSLRVYFPLPCHSLRCQLEHYVIVAIGNGTHAHHVANSLR